MTKAVNHLREYLHVVTHACDVSTQKKKTTNLRPNTTAPKTMKTNQFLRKVADNKKKMFYGQENMKEIQTKLLLVMGTGFNFYSKGSFYKIMLQEPKNIHTDS